MRIVFLLLPGVASFAMLQSGCSSDETTTSGSDGGSTPSCANLPSERIDTITFDPATDCADGGSVDAGDAGPSCDCAALCRQRIGSDIVSCKLLTRTTADCAVKQNCPGR